MRCSLLQQTVVPHATMHDDLSRVEDGPVVCVSEGFDHEGFHRLGFALYLVSLSTSCRSSRPMSQRLASGKHVARYSEMELTTVWLDDMLNRTWDVSAGKIRAWSGSSSVVITRVAAASLDIYVCGFLCTPFIFNGLRQVCFGAGHERKGCALVAVAFVFVVLPFEAPFVSRSKHRQGRTKRRRRVGPRQRPSPAFALDVSCWRTPSASRTISIRMWLTLP